MTEQQTAGTDVPAVELSSITKSFGPIVACDRVDLTLHRGRIHGILGENGAGKSTLMKVLIGLVLPDSGTIDVDGERCQIRDPHDAADRGIGMVHQHFSLVDALTVWENVMLGDTGRFDAAAARRRVGEISERYGLGVEPNARVADLTAGVRQRVEIIKCLRRDPSILIFDEPTSVLTPAESETLFDVLRHVVEEENRAVALVSHKLAEVLQATDEVTIMRAGAVVARMDTSTADAPALARAMVGRDVSLRAEASALGLVDEAALAASESQGADRATSARADIPALRLRDVTVKGAAGVVELDALSLDVAPGEIVGVAGVEGNGQSTLTDLLSSLADNETGTIEVAGVPVLAGKPGAMARAGIGVIPEDRHASGCVLDMTVAENLQLVDLQRIAKRGIYDPADIRRRAVSLIDEFDIQTAGPDAPFWSLSGGNQQRVVLARELSAQPKVLVASQPTRGLDVGRHRVDDRPLRATAASGVGVLLISSELEEILELSDRIVVLFRGRVVGEMVARRYRSRATRAAHGWSTVAEQAAVAS